MAKLFHGYWRKMDYLRVLFLGTVLLFIHSSADASTIREMFIEEQPPADDSGEEVKTEHAHVSEEEDSRSSDLTEFDLQPADFSFDDAPSEDIEENSDDDLNENDVGRWLGRNKIAFSAYLSSDVTLGRRQHVKFDKVLLNDGNGYRASTGVFRAPTCGVYSFTFVVAQHHGNEIRLNLVVDGKVVLGAIAEGTKYYHDVQGTNTVNVFVRKDKPVWVEAYSSGRVEGNNSNFRYTSFSGHLLYRRR